MVSVSRKIRDEEIVALVRKGHAEAFDHLVLRYQEKIYRLARRLTRTEEDAEDVLQEAFVKAYQSLPDFKGTSRFYTWLYRITINLALMKLRKDRFRFVSLDEPVETERGEVRRDFPHAGRDPLAELIQKESNCILDRAIEQLSPTSRAVFVLRHVEGLSTEETGRVLNLSAQAIKSRLHRARTALAERLGALVRDDARASCGARR